eukprot:TRINITY_DN50791_c0_g1_i1.p2 TRINITY_DN50791_c0_g1~~TRINITY_DN50791_c0_g1_i1.p2  ORF type:complete len:182 (-),score=27.15 TRINITY_DN50791_c0_g1_i1:136-681(-)
MKNNKKEHLLQQKQVEEQQTNADSDQYLDEVDCANISMEEARWKLHGQEAMTQFLRYKKKAPRVFNTGRYQRLWQMALEVGERQGQEQEQQVQSQQEVQAGVELNENVQEVEVSEDLYDPLDRYTVSSQDQYKQLGSARRRYNLSNYYKKCSHESQDENVEEQEKNFDENDSVIEDIYQQG